MLSIQVFNQHLMGKRILDMASKHELKKLRKFCFKNKTSVATELTNLYNEKRLIDTAIAIEDSHSLGFVYLYRYKYETRWVFVRRDGNFVYHFDDFVYDGLEQEKFNDFMQELELKMIDNYVEYSYQVLKELRDKENQKHEAHRTFSDSFFNEYLKDLLILHWILTGKNLDTD